MIFSNTQQNIPKGWTMKQFDDCVILPTKIKGLKKTEYKKLGKYPIFDQSQEYISGYTDQDKFLNKETPAILFGDHTRILKYIKSHFVLGADGTKVFWAKNDINPSFLFYSLLNKKIPNTGYNRHFKYLKEKSILLPPIKEQEKIAEILTTVDEEIKKIDEIITAIEKLKDGLMQQIFSSKYKKCKLVDVTELITKGTTPTTYGHRFTDDGVNFIKIENIDNAGNIDLKSCNYISSLTHNFLKRSQLQDGDVLFSIAGALGRIAIINKLHLPANVNQAIAIIRPKDKSNSSFISQVLSTSEVKKQVVGSSVQLAQANISLGKLEEVFIPWTEASEREEISEIIKTIDKKSSINKKIKEKLTLLKKGLMQDLLSGKVRIKI